MEEHEFQYKLGLEVKDKITGFRGILVYRVQYLTGCDQYGINPGCDDKGEMKKESQFDESRIEVIGDGVSKDPAFNYEPINEELANEEPVKTPPGGPNTFVSKQQ